MKAKSKFERAKSKLSRQVKSVAEAQARIPAPQCLSEAITSYVECHAFAYWVRLVLKMEGTISAALRGTLEERCTGFLVSAAARPEIRPEGADSLWLLLIAWKNDDVFAFAKAQGWSDALSYYAARDPRMDRFFAYWEECDETWKPQERCVLPAFEEWHSKIDK